MPDFVWIVPAERLSSLGDGGISPNYIIPQGQMHGHEKRLGARRLWIVLRGAGDRCMAVAEIKKVEKFNEGYYAHDFLISCDTTTSFRLCASFEGAKPYAVADFQGHEVGVHQIEKDVADKLKKQIAATIQIKLVAPADVALKRIKFDVVPKKGAGLARAALSQITQTFPLDQVWAAGAGAKLGPFGNFTARLLSLHEHDPSTVTDFLKKVDPVSFLSDAGTTEAMETPKASAPSFEKSVDLDFTEIDPETVYAREFVSSEGMLPDLESALSKTEAAEKLHQDMLRDISSYLKTQGYPPYESSSVDLMISAGEKTKIFEIKSSTPVNIVAQAAKGAFQIACYVNAMTNDYQPLEAALILHKIEETALEKFVHDALNRLGVKYLTYDPSKKWPDRVNGLLT